MTWGYSEEFNPDGYGVFYIQAWKGDGTRADITFFRGVPSQITSMHFGDPFGDSLATLEFPQCTGFDSGTGDTWWLNENINIDILWVPATTVASDYPVMDPRTNKYGTMFLHPEDAVPHWEGFITSIDPQVTGVSVNCQGALYQLDRYYAKPLFPQRPKAVEAMIERLFDPRRRGLYTQGLKIDWEGNYSDYVWGRTYTQQDYNKFRRQDAILQRYVPTDLDITDPWTGYVTRMTGSWDKALTGYIQSQLALLYVDLTKMPVTTGLTDGDKWTITKDAGRLPVMYLKRQAQEPDFVVWYGQPGVDAQLTRDGSVAANVVFGRGTGYDQTAWMVQNFPEKAPWSTWAPIAWDKDPNTAFGSSTGVDADGNPIGIYHWDDTGWYDEVEVETGEESGMVPLREALYDGYDAEWERANNYWVQERYWSNIPPGFSQEDGEDIARQYIERDKNPGWTGTITIKVDGRDLADNPVSKWNIKDGSVIWLKGFRGTSTTDYTAARGTAVFYVAQSVQDPQSGTVTLTVDTKFRDLLSINEVMMHTRDSLAPVRMLQIGKQSGMIEDLSMPWNSAQGSGFFPKYAVEMERETTFPYETDTQAQPPVDIFKPKYVTGSLSGKSELIRTNGDLRRTTLTGQTPFYVPVNIGNPNYNLRWAFLPVMLSQAGTIVRSEFCAYDKNGNVAENVEFSVAVFYSTALDIQSMPQITDEVAWNAEIDRWNNTKAATFFQGKASGLFKNAWYSVDPESGLKYQGLTADYHMPNPDLSLVIGWGTYEMPAGYSPGSKQQGATPECTGQLVDGANWGYNFSEVGEFNAKVIAEDPKIPARSYSVGVAIYAQYKDEINRPADDWVYFMGRFYRQTQQGV